MTPQEFAEAAAGHTAEERLFREQLSRDPSADMFEAHKKLAGHPSFDLFPKEGVEVLAGVEEHPAVSASVYGVEPVMDHAAREIAGHPGESYLAGVLETQEALETTLAQQYGGAMPAYGLGSWPPGVPSQGESPELLALRGLELERVALGFADGVAPDIAQSRDVGHFPIPDIVDETGGRVVEVRRAAAPFVGHYRPVVQSAGPRYRAVEAEVDHPDSAKGTAASASLPAGRSWDLGLPFAMIGLLLGAFSLGYEISVSGVDVRRLVYGSLALSVMAAILWRMVQRSRRD